MSSRLAGHPRPHKPLTGVIPSKVQDLNQGRVPVLSPNSKGYAMLQHTTHTAATWNASWFPEYGKSFPIFLSGQAV